MEALRVRPTPGTRLASRVSRASSYMRNVGRSARLPWLAPLILPVEGAEPLTIGRAPDCDLVLMHPTISRHHATLRPRAYGWELVDLGSMNGTRVNGWHLGAAQLVRDGDIVSFGALSLAVTDHP